MYECSTIGCKNKTTTSAGDDVLIIERSTITVRAHEPRTGTERWNFSVGLHNVKIPQISCIEHNSEVMLFDLEAIIPEGRLSALTESKSKNLWTYNFNSPIVNIWKWDGKNLVTVNLFSDKENSVGPSIYVGMHNKQLYIHESDKLLNDLQINIQHTNVKVVESQSLAKIPWKPYPAVALDDKPSDYDQSSALSVLYSSEYINGKL